MPAAPRQRVRIRHFLAGILVAVVVGCGVITWHWVRYGRLGPQLTRLDISGALVHVSPARVRTAIKPLLGGGFFRVDVDRMRAAVQALPWVAHADVTLHWPSTVKVTVREQHAVAVWNQKALLNAKGEVFVHNVAASDATLLHLSGADGSGAHVLTVWRALAATLKPAQMQIKRFRIDQRGAWWMTLASGLRLHLGRMHPRQNLARFMTLVPRVLGVRMHDAAYIDLRYTHGFAVGWKSDDSPEPPGAGHPSARAAPAHLTPRHARAKKTSGGQLHA